MTLEYTQKNVEQQEKSLPRPTGQSGQESNPRNSEPEKSPESYQTKDGMVSVITSINPATLGKIYSLSGNGLQKQVAGHLIQGRVDAHNFRNIEEFIRILKAIGNHQALCASVPVLDSCEIVPKRNLDNTRITNAIARSKDYFSFPFGQPGVLVLDYDPPCGTTSPSSMEELWTLLCTTVPQVTGAGVAWWCSSSSYIYCGETQLQGLRGQRLYVQVSDVSDIERCGRVLAKRLWLAGHGRIQVSSSGAKLVRSTFDTAMHELARLDFVGGAICHPPLEQRRGNPVALCEGGWMNTRTALPDLTDVEEAEYEAKVHEAKQKAQNASIAARYQWISDRRLHLEETLRKKGVAPEIVALRAEQTLKNALENVLYGDFEVELDNGQRVTVATILDHPETYHGRLTKDPLEPDYENGKIVGKLYLMGHSRSLHSFAHGGATYRLRRQPHRVISARGARAELVRAFINSLNEEGDIFAKSGNLVQVTKCGLRLLKEHSLANIIDSRVALFAIDKKGEEYPTNVSIETCKIVASQADGGDFRELAARCTLPYARPDGRLVERPGYDSGSRIYADFQPDILAPVAQFPTDLETINALRTLWRPWCMFPFAESSDRGAMVAAIFTAVCRPAFDTAPAFFMDAPVQGSGKTACAAALQALATGKRGGITPFVAGEQSETELSKKLFSMAMAGAGFWLIDNVTGTWRSAVLSAMLTDGAVVDRILGQSQVARAEVRMMICATGNNASVDKDLGRRFIKIRLDSGLESPQTRDFDFDPVCRALEERLEIARAVLTVIRAYVNSGKPELGKGTAGFSDWSRLIRQCVIWCADKGYTTEADIGVCTDPAASILNDSGSDDEDNGALNALLRGLYDVYQQGPFQAKEIEKVWNRNRYSQLQCNGEHLICEGLEWFLNQKKTTVNSLSIGKALKYRRDRPVFGLVLRKAGEDSNGITKWFVERV